MALMVQWTHYRLYLSNELYNFMIFIISFATLLILPYVFTPHNLSLSPFHPLPHLQRPQQNKNENSQEFLLKVCSKEKFILTSQPNNNILC